ncbi:Holliday junction resolvase Hjc [Thermoproteus tenax]|uniref:Crossover junction endodeoxyribonuclease Hjc n=1 Tax=Thermoproteus tenax (strain ATCC 35583 / DSM 2078 / JCM 9277 / NBRC 100435 / Kra 1) TaxID=768679 RepID=G4RMR3_THETK|nr:Holliday junction resolvase Hjc [Thermoproteus tenax]CCC80857.1 holliday junction resolvase, archaeal type [Thermoproteus tenax Kra 1]
MVAPKTKGASKERSVANLLWEKGCAVLRGCSSGGGVRKRFVPDIVAICNGKVLVMELKYRAKRTTVRIEAEKVQGLLEFAARSGGRAFVLVKFGRDQWRVFEVAEGADVSINGEAYDRAPTLDHLLASIFNRQLV